MIVVENPYKPFFCQYCGDYGKIVMAVDASKAKYHYFQCAGIQDSYPFKEAMKHISVTPVQDLDTSEGSQFYDELEYINKRYQLDLKVGDQVMANGNPGWVLGSSGPYVKVGHGDTCIHSYHPRDVKV